jgi:hypothetical protein
LYFWLMLLPEPPFYRLIFRLAYLYLESALHFLFTCFIGIAINKKNFNRSLLTDERPEVDDVCPVNGISLAKS